MKYLICPTHRRGPGRLSLWNSRSLTDQSKYRKAHQGAQECARRVRNNQVSRDTRGL